MILCIRSDLAVSTWVLHDMVLSLSVLLPLVGTRLSLGTLAFGVTVTGALWYFASLRALSVVGRIWPCFTLSYLLGDPQDSAFAKKLCKEHCNF